jgi:hypothetical protein
MFQNVKGQWWLHNLTLVPCFKKCAKLLSTTFLNLMLKIWGYFNCARYKMESKIILMSYLYISDRIAISWKIFQIFNGITEKIALSQKVFSPSFMYNSLHLKIGLLQNYCLPFLQNFYIPLNFCLQLYFQISLKICNHLNSVYNWKLGYYRISVYHFYRT